MMSQTELLAWSEPDTKFFADNLLGVEDWGGSIADVKFNPDDLFLGGEDQDIELESKDDHLNEFLSSLGDPSSPLIEDFDFTTGVCIKEEPLSPSSSNSSCISLPSSPENQFLINGDCSPVHQPNTDFELPQNSLLPSSPSHIKTEATLMPVQCSVKQEKIPIQSCGVKSIQPMPVTTVPVKIQKPHLGQCNTKPAGGIPVYIPCTGSIPTSGVVSVVVGKNVTAVTPSAVPKTVSVGVTGSSPASETDAKLFKRQQRMIKNRESACLSRKKKKEYLQSLENKVKEISSMNESLRVQNESLKRRVNELQVENTLLRSKVPDLTSTIKKSTCVLAVVLFVALNIGPFSTLKEQWKFNRADLIPSSMIHHGRALLNYQGGPEDSSNIDKPLVFGPAANQFRDRQPMTKVDPGMLNTSQKKLSPLRSRNTERRDLMVIKNKWDFLGDSRQKRRNVKRKERNPKTRRKIERKPQNETIDEQSYCPSDFNKTEATRINEALEGWAKRYEHQQIIKQRKHKRKQSKMESAIKELALRLASNCTADVKRKISRHKFSRKHNMASKSNEVQLFQRADKFKTFEEEIEKKSDTLYIVSFRGDHLVLPASEYNATQRPKMSFMIMAPPNRTEWQRDNNRDKDLVTMMQIDCQVMDTKFVNIKRSSIPVPSSDSPYFSTAAPVSSVHPDYSAPAGNTFVKPAK